MGGSRHGERDARTSADCLPFFKCHTHGCVYERTDGPRVASLWGKGAGAWMAPSRLSPLISPPCVSSPFPFVSLPSQRGGESGAGGGFGGGGGRGSRRARDKEKERTTTRKNPTAVRFLFVCLLCFRSHILSTTPHPSVATARRRRRQPHPQQRQEEAPAPPAGTRAPPARRAGPGTAGSGGRGPCGVRSGPA